MTTSTAPTAPASSAIPAGIRTTRGCLQTAVHTWARAEDDRKITILGTCHIGEARYYRELTSFINDARSTGAAVHYECIRRATDAELQHATDVERHAARRDSRSRLELDRKITAMAGLVCQVDAMPDPHGGINTDLSQLDLIRMIGPDHIIAESEFEDSLSRMAPWIGGRVIRAMIRNLGHLYRLPVKLVGDDPTDSIVIDRRNEIAAAAALGVPPGTPVVAVWGAGHLSGIGALLQEKRFTLQAVDWLTVVSRRRLPHAA